MSEIAINENIQTEAKKPRVLYIIQGIMFIVGLISSCYTLSYLDSESDTFFSSLFGSIAGIIFAVILAIGFFRVKDKSIGKTWIASAVVAFAFDLLGVLSGANAFLLLVSILLMIFKIILAKGFLAKNVNKVIIIAPILLGIYILLASVYQGIIYADTYSYRYYWDKTELFFEGFGSGLLSNFISNLLMFGAAYLILLFKSGKIKIKKTEKRQPVIAPQQKELSATEKADILKEYKELLDSGIMTQEEYDEKKNSILNANK